jgi:hypothetical protein
VLPSLVHADAGFPSLDHVVDDLDLQRRARERDVAWQVRW